MNTDIVTTPLDPSFTCKQAVTIYCDSRDRPLTVAEQRLLQHHVEHCHPCSIASQQMASLFNQLDILLAGQESTT
jgi:hypothetical protein